MQEQDHCFVTQGQDKCISLCCIYVNGPGSDKRDLKGIKVKIKVFKVKEINNWLSLTFPENLKGISLLINVDNYVLTSTTLCIYMHSLCACSIIIKKFVVFPKVLYVYYCKDLTNSTNLHISFSYKLSKRHTML